MNNVIVAAFVPTCHTPTAEQRLMITALVCRSIPYVYRNQRLLYRVERVSRADYRASWIPCPATYTALVRRLDQD